jgi:DNA-binding GntR family transcriptional regulator
VAWRPRRTTGQVATADLRFHRELAALAGSPRIDELMRRVLAELRLAFHIMPGPQEFHEPYLRRNRIILELLESSCFEEATRELNSYLMDAERQLLDAFDGHPPHLEAAPPLGV